MTMKLVYLTKGDVAGEGNVFSIFYHDYFWVKNEPSNDDVYTVIVSVKK